MNKILTVLLMFAVVIVLLITTLLPADASGGKWHGGRTTAGDTYSHGMPEILPRYSH